MSASFRERAFERKLTDRPAGARHFSLTLEFGKFVRVARSSDGDDSFDRIVIGDMELQSRPFVVEALHTVNDEALQRSLEREILPCRTCVE